MSCWIGSGLTGQFADKPTRGQSSRGLVNSQTSQLAEMFDGKFECIIALSVTSGEQHYLYTLSVFNRVGVRISFRFFCENLLSFSVICRKKCRRVD